MSKWKFNWKENLAVAFFLILFLMVIVYWDEIKRYIAETFF